MFINTEQTESRQEMEQLHVVSDTSSSHPRSTSNKDNHVMSRTCKPSATMAGASVHRDACVQTEPLATVSSSSSQPALTGYPTSVTVGHHYGKEYLDPSPILPHVISPDALEGTYQILTYC